MFPEEVTMSFDLLAGLILGGLVPLILWAFTVLRLVKQTRDMHLEPDEHGFGSIRLAELLEANLEKQAENQREYLNTAKALNFAFRELAHYMKWMVRETIGKPPPPFVRDEAELSKPD